MRLPVHVGFVLPVIRRADSAADSGIGHRPRIGPQLTSPRVDVQPNSLARHYHARGTDWLARTGTNTASPVPPCLEKQ